MGAPYSRVWDPEPKCPKAIGQCRCRRISPQQALLRYNSQSTVLVAPLQEVCQEYDRMRAAIRDPASREAAGFTQPWLASPPVTLG